jgi:3-dehydroquinate dehydratase/shikimate dehydrogenase
MTTLQTERLRLRPWQESDFAPFAKMNADPVVRQYFPSLLNREESDVQALSFANAIEERGWGLWAVSLIEDNAFIGFIGLTPVPFEAHFTPAVEIGWRLTPEVWGQGLAVEGAKAALQYGFETLLLHEIVSITTVSNQRSRRVMEKLGMHHDPKDDFDHPKLVSNHPLTRHVLYRIKPL